MADASIVNLLEWLATGNVAGWTGLPARADWRAALGEEDVEGPGLLGDDSEPATFVRTSVPATGATARLWIRDEALVLVDVPVAADAGLDAAALGSPERQLDTRYGLVPLPQGEWVYAARGLALIVAAGPRIVHALGFVPCGADVYVRRLRVHFATTRRPLGRRGMEDDL